MSTDIQNAVSNALRGQSWFVRRKDTIAAVAGTIVQVLNLMVFMTAGAPEWVNALIAVTVGIAQTLVHAATPGAITPSMERRLEQAALQPAPVTAETTAYSEGEQAARLFAQATPNSEDPEHEAVSAHAPHEHGSGH
ncbi:hypothetical protein QP933_06725 [Corynebacterium pseudodiphtheriticum]|uniref:hypothetical protein n=1 Tax=Corynebacterium pseudodiphtheriticum TaxID=37637 RepID=UPI00254F4658|nr:hypothetical protein [Corynebacterium pseudodiphtheriticum]MDK8500632.1 hypothetical protein [Corynebacterium pseudodiphtheriticum]MDK8775809.1 hypothetical protein [Corynebacterium pseudodiphtheriticum]